MAVVATAVAAAVTWVSSAAASAAALVATSISVYGGVSIGTAIAITNSLASLAASSLGSFALNAVFAPKVNAGGSPIVFKADPSSPIRGIMGRFGTAGTQNHMRVWGKNNLFISYSVILSLGPIEGIEKFTANKVDVNFTLAQGQAADVEPYKGKMWMTYKNGLPGDPALGPPVGISDGHVNPMNEWTVNHRTTGYAGAFWTMKNNSKRASYEGGVPVPNWTVLGQKLYDPRKDSTRTDIGGVGAHRWDDWRTWEFSKNPEIHALNWALGHHKKLPDGVIDRRYLLAGVGATIDKIDLPTFVAGANISDANNWTVSGEWSTQDDKWQVLASMLQAGSAVPAHVGAKIGIMVNAPRTSVATITSDDIIGKMNVKVMAARRDRFNTIYPRYINEQQGWEYSTAGAVTAETYRLQDGGAERSKEMTYNYVDNSLQAGQLAAYDLANTRETLKVAFPAKPHLLGIKPGDAVTVYSEEHGLDNQKFIVMARPIELMEGTVAFELRSETDSKHAFALGQTDQPAPSPALTGFATAPEPPLPGEWDVVARPPEPGGTSQPGVVVTGEVPDGIGSVLVEVALAEAGPWQQVYDGPPTTQNIDITGLESNATYWVAFTYRSVRAGIPSSRLILGPYTTPALISDSSNGLGDQSSADVINGIIALDDAVADLDIRTQDVEADINDPTTGLIVRVGNSETATATLADRVEVVEIDINTPGTGLLARTGELETVTADLELGKADASRVTVVEAAVEAAKSQLVPATFENNGQFFRSAYNGAPFTGGVSLDANPVFSFPVVAGIGKVLEVAASPWELDMAPQAAIPLVPGRRLRMTVRWRQLAGSAFGTVNVFNTNLDAAYILGTGYTSNSDVGGPLGTWYLLSIEFDSDTLIAGGGVYWRPLFRVPGSVDSVWQVQYIRAEDVTEANAISSVSARTASLETATADLEAGKADASRVTDLEATVLKGGTGLPYSFSDEGHNWITNYGGDPATLGRAGSSFGRTYPIVAGVGKVMSVALAAGAELGTATLGVIRAQAGHSYRTSIRVRRVGGSPSAIAYGYVIGLNSAWSLVYAPAANVTLTVDGQWYETSFTTSGTDAIAAGTEWLRGFVVTIATGGAATLQVDYCKLEDITDVTSLSARITTEENARVDGDSALASRTTVLEARSGGSNLLTKSQFFHTNDFAPFAGGNGGLTGYNPRIFTTDTNRAPLGEYAYLMQETGDGNASFAEANSMLVPVEAGHRVCLSVLAGCDNVDATLFFYVADAAGNLIGNSAGVDGVNWCYSGQGAVAGSRDLSEWKRLYTFYDVPAGVASVMLVYRRYGRVSTAYAGYSNAWMLRPMVAMVQPGTTVPPPWSPAALEARVTTNETAVVDHTNNFAEARLTFQATSPGGTPVLTIQSNSYGNSIKLNADELHFGDNTFFDDATDTMRTTIGANVRVVAYGAAFGIDGQLTEWEGPSSVAFASMSRANAYFYRANVAPFVGGSGFTAAAAGFTVTPSGTSAFKAEFTTGNITTPVITLTPSGNTGAVTYSWSNTFGDSTMVATSPTGAASAFRGDPPAGGKIQAIFNWTATDAGTGQVRTGQVYATVVQNV